MPTEHPTPPGAQIKLKLAGVSKRYGDIDALTDAHLLVQKGECVTLLGPSGSGKTTLLNIVAGLLTLDKGEVWIEDRLSTHLPPYARDIGMVFQNYALFPHMNVFGNIAFPLRQRRVGRKEIAERGPMEAARFRDLTGTSRKYVIPILEHLDAAGVTRREGNARVLRAT